MICNNCKQNEAVIHIHEYSENGANQTSLCLECALKMGLSDPRAQVNNLFIKLLENIFDVANAKRSQKNLFHATFL